MSEPLSYHHLEVCPIQCQGFKSLFYKFDLYWINVPIRFLDNETDKSKQGSPSPSQPSRKSVEVDMTPNTKKRTAFSET